MTAQLAIAGAVLGLLIGSFVNVVAHRVPDGVSVVRPPSACPVCGHRIRARDNIPVISWFLLRGRCRDCDTRIPIRYPVVEALTGALFAAAVFVIGTQWVLGAYWWGIAVTMALALADLDHRRIPNAILYPGTVVGSILLVGGAVLDGTAADLGRAGLGAVIYFGALLVLALAARGGFGMGDVKLAVLLGLLTAYRSWDALAVAAFGGFVLGGLVSVALLAMRRVGRKSTIPFGPSMIAAAYLAVPYAESVVDWYLG
jgi:leader peptidase (prepilin peptidase)/N-methyltransferase